MEIKVGQAQSDWVVFKEAPTYKRGVRRSAIWIGSNEFDNSYTQGEAVRALSTVFIIP